MAKKRKKVTKTNNIRKYNYLFVKRLVYKYAVNVLFYRSEEWCNWWSKKIKDKNLKKKALLRLYYFKEEANDDIVEYINMVIKILSIDRSIALYARFPEPARLEHKLDYVRNAISYLKEGAFEDIFVISTLSELRELIYVKKTPIGQKQKYKKTLESILAGLKVDMKLAGAEKKTTPKNLIKTYELMKKLMKKYKRYKNSNLITLELQEVFGSFLSEEDKMDILGVPPFKGARIITGRLFNLAPSAVKDHLHKAKYLSK